MTRETGYTLTEVRVETEAEKEIIQQQVSNART